MTFDDLKLREQLLNSNEQFKFDIKKDHYYIDIYKQNQTFLVFSWTIRDKTRYSAFSVLPSGPKSALSVFIKVMKCLAKFWRINSV